MCQMLAGLEDTALDTADRTPPGRLRSSKPGKHMTGTQPSCAGRMFFFWSRGDESGNLDSLVSDFHEVLCTFFFFKNKRKKF